MKKYLLILCLGILTLSSCTTSYTASTRPAKVIYVKTPPKKHKIVVIKGKRYYFWNGKHHRKTRRGFVVAKVR